MKDDLVVSLRKRASEAKGRDAVMFHRAADEIERLRDGLRELRKRAIEIMRLVENQEKELDERELAPRKPRAPRPHRKRKTAIGPRRRRQDDP